MDLVATLPAFLLAVVLVSASPGPAMALVVRRAATGGGRRAVPTVLGLEAGLFFWAVMAGVGMAALVAASETAYLVLRVAGAGFLGWLGIRALRAAVRGGSPDPTAPAGPVPGTAARFSEGLVVQLANPKAAAFLLALYPQFLPRGAVDVASVLVLATIQVTVETALYLGLAAGVGSLGARLRRPSVTRAIEATTGTVLLGLGLRLAFERR